MKTSLGLRTLTRRRICKTIAGCRLSDKSQTWSDVTYVTVATYLVPRKLTKAVAAAAKKTKVEHDVAHITYRALPRPLAVGGCRQGGEFFVLQFQRPLVLARGSFGADDCLSWSTNAHTFCTWVDRHEGSLVMRRGQAPAPRCLAVRYMCEIEVR